MKIKLILNIYVTLCFLAILSITPVYAKSGDAIGKVYSSDILATVNGYAIESYNIGGKTVIPVDELKNYGFYVWHDESTHRLYITGEGFEISEEVKNANISRGKAGKIAGTHYKTNITAVVNGLETKAYSINGKIYVCIEELGDLEDSVNAEYGYSKYYMRYEWDNENRIISLDTLFSNSGEFLNSQICKNGYGLNISMDKDASEVFVEFEAGFYEGTISGSGVYESDKMLPLRLRCEGENTDFIVGYMFCYNNDDYNSMNSPKFYYFIDVLEKAFDEGYYHAVTREDRIEYINSHFIIFQDDPYERFDTDLCTVIYFEQHGLPHGGSYYSLIIIYMDGSIVNVTNQPLKDIALSDNAEKLTYLNVNNGKTYEVDLATAEVIEMSKAAN